MNTNPPCPACGNPLEKGRNDDTGDIVLYCGDAGGRCPSTKMNDGAEGATEAEALKKLQAVWGEEEP